MIFPLIFGILYGTNNNTVLASMRIGPHVGAVSCGGCEGTIWDGAGRVGAVAVETAATENPGDNRVLQQSGQGLPMSPDTQNDDDNTHSLHTCSETVRSPKRMAQGAGEWNSIAIRGHPRKGKKV